MAFSPRFRAVHRRGLASDHGGLTGSVATLTFVRVVVDRGRCESNALCMAIAPEVFELRDDDVLYLLDESPPEELRSKVEQAVHACPKIALSIVD